MKIYLLAFLCLIAKISSASFISQKETDGSFTQINNETLTHYNYKIFPEDYLNKSFFQQSILKRKKKNLKYRAHHFLKYVLNTTPKSDFSFGGLLLGILLGPVGVAVSYLTKNKKLRKWSLVGCLIDIGIGMLFILITILAVTF